MKGIGTRQGGFSVILSDSLGKGERQKNATRTGGAKVVRGGIWEANTD